MEAIKTKVYGINFTTARNPNLNAAIKQLQPMDELVLKREPDNAADENAISINLKSGEKVGYVSALLAWSMAKEMDNKNCNYFAVVQEVTGGAGDKPNLGVNIEIRKL